MARIVLHRGRERSLERRHPWIFRGAVARVEGSPDSGATVEVVGSEGTRLALGAWSPESQIAVRVWTFDPGEPVDAAFVRRRLERAAELRYALVAPGAAGAVGARAPGGSADSAASRESSPAPSSRTGAAPASPTSPLDAYRLVHAENDGLPGLVVDRYADFLVLQATAAGAERHKREIADALMELAGEADTAESVRAALGPCRGIWERSEAAVRDKEGLPPVSGLLAGEEPLEEIEIREGRHRFHVDPRGGHKTGFYLDQRDNRALVGRLAAGRRVLDVFCFTGGFGVAAGLGGAASVTHLDSSADALERVRRHLALNGLDPAAHETIRGNAFSELRALRAAERRFDLVVLDPPKLVESKRQLPRATRGYKDLNLLACQLLAPGGLLATFSCSGRLGADLFAKIVADAALDAGRDARVVARLGAAADHPVALAFPEGRYLKGLLCRVE